MNDRRGCLFIIVRAGKNLTYNISNVLFNVIKLLYKYVTYYSHCAVGDCISLPPPCHLPYSYHQAIMLHFAAIDFHIQQQHTRRFNHTLVFCWIVAFNREFGETEKHFPKFLFLPFATASINFCFLLYRYYIPLFGCTIIFYFSI